MNYFTADIHFSGVSKLLSDNRPFKSIKQYNKFVIKSWNKIAKADDTIYVIGDLFDCEDETSMHWKKDLQSIKKVRAKIVLIMGNNEDRIVHYFFNDDYLAFERVCVEEGIFAVYHNLKTRMFNKNVFMTHQIKDGKADCINLFGHTHLCSGLYHPYGLCVSTDLNHFRLYNEQNIKDYLKRKKEFWDADNNLNYVNPFLIVNDGTLENIMQRNNSKWKKYISSNFEKLNF